MKVTSIKTHKITPGEDIFSVLDKYLPGIEERRVLAVTSKIVSICEGCIVKQDKVVKDELIKKEAQYFLPRHTNPYHVALTITRNNLVPSAGVDESNGNGYYILWPKNPQDSVSRIRQYLKKRFNLKNIGVIITDSKTTPFRWGVTGMAIAYSGFKPLKSYVGKPDLFGRLFQFEKLSIIDSLAAAAVLTMGEGSEQTPLSLIEDIPNIEFQDRNPTSKELDSLKITPEADLYAPLLTVVKWEKGEGD